MYFMWYVCKILPNRGDSEGINVLYGYGGNILRVNLTFEKIKKSPTDEKFAKEWIGGRGFGAKILWDDVKRVEPLSLENKLIVSSGPLSGLFIPGAGKTHFTSKSPETKGYGDSNMGGLFSAEMKYAGYDSFIIEGRAKRLSYIYIKNENVELRDATHLKGKGSITAELELKKELGEDFQIAIIGPGGENLVKYACISSDYGREAGRAGLGAVMGSKNLKAIAVWGDKDIPVANFEEFYKEAKKCFEDCFKNPNLKPWQKYGTSQVVTWASEIEALPTKNFQCGVYEKAAQISGETMLEKCVKLNKACFGCPMACGKYSYVKKYDVYVEGAEYETLALLGANCGMEDIEDVLMANYLCDEYGIDTISTGNVIAFTMECAEKGLIAEKIRFGDTKEYLELIRKIAFREGIGNILAEGVKFASEKFGAEDLSVQIKGMEQSGYESRAAPAMALSYMTCDVGAHHNRAWAIAQDIKVGREMLEGKAEHVIRLQHIRPLFDMLGVCRLQWVELGIDLNYYARLFSAVTGWKYSLNDLLKTSEKVYNLSRAYWFREVKDFGRKYDLPPARYGEHPTCGKLRDCIIDSKKVDFLLNDYYKLRGWDSEGKPTKAKLKELGLGEVIKEIYR